MQPPDFQHTTHCCRECGHIHHVGYWLSSEFDLEPDESDEWIEGYYCDCYYEDAMPASQDELLSEEEVNKPYPCQYYCDPY
jgi:hypothetical protein